MVGYIVDVDGEKYILLIGTFVPYEAVRRDVERAKEKSKGDMEAFKEILMGLGYEVDVLGGELDVVHKRGREEMQR